MNRATMIVAAAMLPLAAVCDTISISETSGYTGVINVSGDVVTPSCRWSYEGYPSDVVAPVFWLDASDRTGWEYDATDSTLVTKVASKVGTRSLVASPSGVHYPSSYTPAAPRLVTGISALAGGAALDFGSLGSETGLFFDAEPGSVSEAAPGGTNRLSGVGTVIAVYDSSETGGTILGGTSSWIRGTGRNRFANGNSGIWWDNPLFYSSAYSEMYNAFLRVNGFTTLAKDMGLTGGWAVLSL